MVSNGWFCRSSVMWNIPCFSGANTPLLPHSHISLSFNALYPPVLDPHIIHLVIGPDKGELPSSKSKASAPAVILWLTVLSCESWG